MRTSITALGILTLACTAVAQPPTAPRPGVTVGTQLEIPPDQGAIAGRVTHERTRQPIAGAVVSVSGGDGEQIASTNDDGRWAVVGLAPGAYRIYARGDGFLERQYGQRAAGDTGRTVDVRGGAATRNVDIALNPAGRASGRVFGADGDGLSGVEVELLTTRLLGNRERLVPVGFAQSDEDGRFSIGNLAPGEYLLRAHTGSQRRPVGDEGEVYATTYFPNAPTPTLGQPLLVGGGQQLPSLDFALLRVRPLTLGGLVVGADGVPAPGSGVMLMQQGFESTGGMRRLETDGHGRFHVNDLLPGSYQAQAIDPRRSLPVHGGEVVLELTEDLDDLLLVIPAGARISGRVLAEAGRVLEADLSSLTVGLEIRPGDGRSVSGPAAPVTAEGTFSADGIGGAALVTLRGLPSPWRVASIRHNNLDVTYDAIDLGEGDHAEIEIRVTDAPPTPTAVTGEVTDRRGQRVDDYLVVIFAERRDRLESPTPFVQATRPDASGRFRVTDLSPADYLAVAVEGLRERAWDESRRAGTALAAGHPLPARGGRTGNPASPSGNRPGRVAARPLRRTSAASARRNV